ncbi:hypothetical protein FO519_010203 [Halicephalobus sp. NKZ332]|nr:hypothetical protein FO519_010203 [Halicephalobus sp. NKZ332]
MMDNFESDVTVSSEMDNSSLTPDISAEGTTIVKKSLVLPSNLEITIHEEVSHEEVQPSSPRNNFEFYPVRSVICNTLDEDLQPSIEQISHFEQVLGKGFSKYDDKEVCREILDIFNDHPLQHIYDTEDSTSEHNFIALRNHGIEISLAIFYSHPMTSEIISKFGNIVLHLDLIFFKNSQITKNISLQ